MMMKRLTTRIIEKSMRNDPEGPGSSYHICYLSIGSEYFIGFSSYILSRQDRFAYPDIDLRFDSKDLLLEQWSPFLKLSKCKHLLLRIDELEANEFKLLFKKIDNEITADYIYRDDHLTEVIRLIILLIVRIAELGKY